MAIKKVKFTATKEMPSYNGHKDGSIIEVDEKYFDKLLLDYPENFGGKKLPPKDDAPKVNPKPDEPTLNKGASTPEKNK